MKNKAEKFTVASCLIRSVHRYPGGPIVGFVVIRAGRVLAVPYGKRNWIDAARRSAVRFAKGRHTQFDENHAACWFGYEPESPGSLPARPRWLAWVKGYTVKGDLSKDHTRYLFHRSTGIAPRPRYGPLKPRRAAKPAAFNSEPMMKFEIDPAPARSPHRPLVRAGVLRGFNSYAVPGVVTITAFPDRPMAHARQLARRILRDRAYLSEAVRMLMPGIVVVRPAAIATNATLQIA